MNKFLVMLNFVSIIDFNTFWKMTITKNYDVGYSSPVVTNANDLM